MIDNELITEEERLKKLEEYPQWKAREERLSQSLTWSVRTIKEIQECLEPNSNSTLHLTEMIQKNFMLEDVMTKLINNTGLIIIQSTCQDIFDVFLISYIDQETKQLKIRLISILGNSTDHYFVEVRDFTKSDISEIKDISQYTCKNMETILSKDLKRAPFAYKALLKLINAIAPEQIKEQELQLSQILTWKTYNLKLFLEFISNEKKWNYPQTIIMITELITKHNEIQIIRSSH